MKLKELSLDDIRSQIYDLINPPSEVVSMSPTQRYSYIEELYQDYVIVEAGEDVSYKIPYTIADEEITLSDRSEWTEVEQTWVEKEGDNLIWSRETPKEDVNVSGKEVVAADNESAKEDEKLERNFIKGLKKILGFSVEEKPATVKEMPETEKFHEVVKTLDGDDWLVTWTTNAFKDREKQIITTKALEDYVERHEKDDVKGEYWFWHIKGSRFGEIQWQGVAGRFLVEAGPFDDTPMGKAVKEFLAGNPNGHPEIAPFGWGTSHGFFVKEGDEDDDVFDWIEKYESTILPVHKAANIHSPKPEVVTVKKEQLDALKGIVGDERANAIVDLGDSATAEKEGQVEFKELDNKPEITQPVDTKAKPKEEGSDESAVTREEFDAFSKDVGDAMVLVAEQQKAILDSIMELKSDDDVKIAKDVELTPNASLKDRVKSVIGAEETKVDGRTSLVKDGPEQADPIDEGSTGIALIDGLKALNSRE